MNVFYLTAMVIIFMMENTFLNVYYPNRINNPSLISVSVKDWLSYDYYDNILNNNALLYVPRNKWAINTELRFVTIGINSNEFAEKNTSLFNLTGDVSVNLVLKYSSKKINYNLTSEYFFGYNFDSKDKFSITFDELDLKQSFLFKAKMIKFTFNSMFSSQFFDSFEDDLLSACFLSPGKIQYSFGFYFEDNKAFSKRISLNIASVQSILMLNQTIYKNQDVEIINGVEKGGLFVNRVGLSVNYFFEKDFKHYVRIRNSGSIFFPGEEIFFSDKWIDKFNVNLENEIVLFRNGNYSFAIISKFDYNRYDSHSIEWYNKFTISIKIK